MINFANWGWGIRRKRNQGRGGGLIEGGDSFKECKGSMVPFLFTIRICCVPLRWDVGWDGNMSKIKTQETNPQPFKSSFLFLKMFNLLNLFIGSSAIGCHWTSKSFFYGPF